MKLNAWKKEIQMTFKEEKMESNLKHFTMKKYAQ